MAQKVILTVDGERYELHLERMTALDAKEFRATVGVSLTQALANQSADLDVLAGLIWMARRAKEPRLQYETVARSLNYDSDVDLDSTDAGEVEPDPET